ncbi:MAG: Arginyl-tRNA synthetase, partial [uncultured Corynebacteriales bacterium]
GGAGAVAGVRRGERGRAGDGPGAAGAGRRGPAGTALRAGRPAVQRRAGGGEDRPHGAGPARRLPGRGPPGGPHRADRAGGGGRARFPQRHPHRRRALAPGGRPGRRPAARDRHTGAGPAHGDRLLRAEHRQGDARRAPAYDDHRRQPGAHPRLPRRRGGPAEPRRRLGHPVRDAHPVPGRASGRPLAPGRPGRGHRRGLRAGPALPGRPGPVRGRRRLRRPGPPPGGRPAGRRPADGGHLADDRGGVRDRVRPAVRPPRRAADPGRLRRRVDVQRPARGGRGRARGGRGGPAQRGRALRLRPRLHRPGRRAGPAAGPQERRRLRVRHHRPGHHPAPAARPAGRPPALRGRRPAVPALRAGLRRRPGRRLAAGHGRGRARRLRDGPRPGRPAVQDPLRRHRTAGRAARRGRDPGPGRRGREEPRAAGGGAGPDRRAGRDRLGEVRRPVHRTDQGLRVRPGPDGVAQRQHRRLPAVRARPDPVPAAPGGGAGARARPGRRRRHRRTGRGRAAAGPPPRPVRRGTVRHRRRLRAAPPLRLPVLAGQGIHRVLRDLPGAGGRDGRAAGQPAGPERAGGRHPARRSRPARHRRPRPAL